MGTYFWGTDKLSPVKGKRESRYMHSGVRPKAHRVLVRRATTNQAPGRRQAKADRQ